MRIIILPMTTNRTASTIAKPLPAHITALTHELCASVDASFILGNRVFVSASDYAEVQSRSNIVIVRAGSFRVVSTIARAAELLA